MDGQGLEDWLEGAAFVDPNGRPIVWCHGTDVAEGFNVFAEWGESSIGFHFGTREVAAYRLADIVDTSQGEAGGAIIEVICRARTPLRLPDLFTWGQLELANALLAAGVLRSDEEAEFVAEEANEEAIFAALEEAGYDAVVYGNACEHKQRMTDSIFVWRAELLKSPAADVFDRDDPRLLPAVAAPSDADDLDRWRDLAARIEEARDSLRRFRIDRVESLPMP